MFYFEIAGSGCPDLSSQRLMYKAFEGAPFTPSLSAPFQWYLKLIKATQKGKKSEQGCEVELGTSRRTEGHALTNYAILAPVFHFCVSYT